MSWIDLPKRTDPRATRICLGVALAAGALWVVAAPPIGVWPLGWVALAPTLWLVDKAATRRRAALYAWLSGAAASAGGFRWFASLLSDQAHLPWVLGVLGVLLLASYQGLIFFFMARAIRALRKRGWPMALCAPLALVTFEKVVPVIFPYFLAITQAPVPIAIQVADLAGPYAVSALIAASSGAIYDGLTRRRRPPVIAAVVILAALGYGAIRIHMVEGARAAAPHARIGLVSAGVPASADHVSTRAELATQLAALQRASADAEARGADLIVWSEGAYPFILPHDLAEDFPEGSPTRIRRGFTVPAVIGALTSTTTPGAGPWNSAFLLAADGHIAARHDKVHRVLGSEYNPLVEKWPSLARWMPEGAGHFDAGPAPVALPVVVHGVPVQLGVMICFEDILPASSRDLADLEPGLLVNMSEDSWFGPDEPWQHLGLAVFRAVEVRADLVRAVNLGPSSLVDATGRVVVTAPLAAGGPHVLVVDAALVEGGHTVYAAVGDLFAWLCAIPVLWLWLWPWLRRTRLMKPFKLGGGKGKGGGKGGRKGRSKGKRGHVSH
jgi:apolipoprotein N-acyltransferase